MTIQKICEIFFINSNNAQQHKIPSSLVKNNNTLVFYKLFNCSNEEYEHILNYRSWLHRYWFHGTQKTEKKYFVIRYQSNNNDKNYKIIYTTPGFSSILIRYLQNKLNYEIKGKEQFQAINIKLPEMKFKLWDFQQDAVNAWINSGSYGIIKAATASGKSIMACYIIKKMETRTVILVHSSDLLLNVWFNYLIEQFGESIKQQIGIIGGRLSNKDRRKMNICNDSFVENINKHIVIATVQTLLHHLPELGNQRFGLLISDEIHRMPSDQFQKVTNAIRTAARLGLSATLLRSDGMSPMMNGLIGNIVYKTSIKELAKRGFLVEPIFKQIIIDDIECQDKINNCELKLLEYSKYVKKISASSTLKFNYITNLCRDLVNNNHKFMLYTDYVNNDPKNEIQVFTRSDYFNKLHNEYNLNVKELTKEMTAMDRECIFNELRNSQLDGIVLGAMGNEGINIKSVDSIIMANATASTIKFPQRTGRAMRQCINKTNCTIYEVLLNTHKELEWSERSFIEYYNEGYRKEHITINSDNHET